MLGFNFLLDSGLHVADVTEAPAARDVDDAAPLVTANGRWAATWAFSLRCRASSKRLWSGYVMPLALVRGIKEAESQLVKQLLYRGIVGPSFYLKAACHPLPNSAAGEMAAGLRPYERRALSISAPSNEHNA